MIPAIEKLMNKAYNTIQSKTEANSYYAWLKVMKFCRYGISESVILDGIAEAEDIDIRSDMKIITDRSAAAVKGATNSACDSMVELLNRL